MIMATNLTIGINIIAGTMMIAFVSSAKKMNIKILSSKLVRAFIYNILYMNLYSGGPDEFILALPRSKYNYFVDLLKTNSSLGIAMEILGLPFEKRNKKIIEIVGDKVLTNADVEEEIFYKNTIFKYKYIKDQRPKIIISFKKVFNLKNIFNSVKILITQAKWMTNIDKIINNFQNKLSDFSKNKDVSFEKEVFPYLIAIGYLNEYFSLLAIQGKTDSKSLQINQLIDGKTTISKRPLIIVRKLRALRSVGQKLIFLRYSK